MATTTTTTPKKRKALTEPECEQILELHHAGVSTHEISKRVGRARGTVRGFLKDPESYGRRRRMAGRRTKLDAATQQFVMREAIKGGKTYAQIVEEAPVKMSVRTLQRFLRRCSDARRGRPLPLPVDESASSSDDEDGDDEGGGDDNREHQQQCQQASMITGVTQIAPSIARPPERQDEVRTPDSDEREPTNRELLQLVDRRFAEMTQRIAQLVEGQNAILQLLLKSNGASTASSASK